MFSPIPVSHSVAIQFWQRVHIFLPWAKAQLAPTHPSLWYIARRSGPGEGILLSEEANKPGGEHWGYFETRYESILLRSLITKGETGAASELFLRMQKRATTSKETAELLCARGVAYGQRGEVGKAIDDFSEAIRLYPRSASAYFNRGCALAQRRQPDKAIADYTEAIRIDPSLLGAYYNRASVFYDKGEYDKAIADYAEATRLDAKCAVAYYGRGCAYEKKGESVKAEADFAEAKRLGFKGE
jgi:tetratricopeptide (TPR) repeat protein